MRRPGARPGAPVIMAGNFIVGCAGKQLSKLADGTPLWTTVLPGLALHPCTPAPVDALTSEAVHSWDPASLQD